MQIKLLRFFLLGSLFLISQRALAWDQSSIDAFIKRVVGAHAGDFITEYLPKENGHDVFELQSRDGKIILRGADGLGIGSALNYYLRHFCHRLPSWNDMPVTMPDQLPVVDIKVHRTSPYRYRYYLNYCTFNYSMAWWNWERWQQEIDWMTLNGINMPLAITGEEAIWNKVYRKMGFTQPQLDSFFCGPSYFAWFWMGNLDAWDGPLSNHWMESRELLQKKIVKAERAMGMTTVLPAFTGHVPPSFLRKFPNAKIKKTNWRSGFNDVLILDPSDPLFDSIGKMFLTEQTRAYGTDHFYSADTFNENIPPTGDSTYLNDISKKVFSSMSAVDERAVWVMQGWMFHYDSAYWKPRQIQALLNAVPDDQMLILDLYSESFPLWKKTKAYYGKPWIWNMLHNFGGNISLWGRIDPPALDPAAALKDNAAGKFMGIGLTPEAIEQNPVLYHLMLENVWQDEPINVSRWLKEYALQRYGISNADVDRAWSLLSKSVYRGGLTEGGPESILTARPTLDSNAKWARTTLDYDPATLVKAWDYFILAAPHLRKSEGFRYDLVDVTRQVLANYANTLHRQFATAFRKKDRKAFINYSIQFLQLMDDLDRLLNTRQEFLLGKWINDARSNGISSKEKSQYELNARNLITLWGGKESPLHDYSCRQWAGLIKGFYKPRWQLFIGMLDNATDFGNESDPARMTTALKNWEWNWVNRHEIYRAVPIRDEIQIANSLYKKYRKIL